MINNKKKYIRRDVVIISWELECFKELIGLSKINSFAYDKFSKERKEKKLEKLKQCRVGLREGLNVIQRQKYTTD